MSLIGYMLFAQTTLLQMCQNHMQTSLLCSKAQAIGIIATVRIANLPATMYLLALLTRPSFCVGCRGCGPESTRLA